MKRLALASIMLLAAGASGAQDQGGAAERWSSYRDFWFGHDSVRLHAGDSSKVSDVADYVKRNPSSWVGIDGAADSGDEDAGVRRVAAIRSALIQAGVPASRIRTGPFGDPQLRRERRVEVLLGN